ncbi:purine operon repressor, PurR [Clostridium sp. USBA 49]|jgi:purine operon repressor|uniref:pur operon repressor n=1 Tax=Clostridium TaxID=1485 RepID=UPI00099A723D|nr:MULTISPECIES: pur operon repressor [Clostridium]SKA78803.1 purine operon repressor, PurR [Clostridium sp. USBA 49]
MEKINRNTRIAAITKILIENPNKVINLNTFTEKFNSAKSTISEDILVIKETLNKFNMGKIETIAGASGGVKYVCEISDKDRKDFAEELCGILKEKDRIIPGNYIYMTDIMYNPDIIKRAGLVLASAFNDKDVDCVVTVETKGIPLAYEVSKMLGVQLVIVRRDTKVTEGTTVSINYVTGSSKRIQTMSLSRKALKSGSKCIFIDDFMKAGGTALGIVNMLKEFDSFLVGIGVMIEDIKTPKKLIEDYISIVKFNGIGEDGTAILFPSK